MTLVEVLRNALLAGFGVQEKVSEFVGDLVKKGELSESQGAKLVKEWTEKADKSSEQLNKSLSLIINRTMDKMALPTKDDIERLNRRVQALAARVKKLEGSRGEVAQED